MRVTAERTGGGNVTPDRVADEGTKALIAAEEEQFVLLDGSAHHAAELLQLGGQLVLRSGVEEVAGGPRVVAAKGVSRTVKGVGPGPDSHVYDGPGPPAILRFRILLEVEFLNGVDRQDRSPIGERTWHTANGAVIVEIGVDHAVQHPHVLVRPSVVAALSPGRAARIDRHARTKGQQILVIAAIQGHVVDVRVVKCASEGGTGGI